MADGMTIRVRLPILDEKMTLKIPSAWLTEKNGKIGVYVLKNKKAYFKQITQGTFYDQRVEILSGLNDQDKVIKNPSGLKNGQSVRY